MRFEDHFVIYHLQFDRILQLSQLVPGSSLCYGIVNLPYDHVDLFPALNSTSKPEVILLDNDGF